tara:strand:+ start:894 stop:1364 length:471 start_codon:yes stop_codon:yes gene_type:complete
MNIKYFKNLLFFIIFILISNCGYQPLLTDKNQVFSVNSFNILGDKKLGQALANKFNKIEAAENNLTLEIKAGKKRTISNRSSAGAILEYTITIDFHFKAFSEMSGKKVFENSFSESRNYKSSTMYIDTLNREKKIVDNLIKSVANQINTQLNIIFK